ncbi:hypothetical protein [Herbidospora sp. NBRC 101105]|uniref:hypothetical protein n=1 Tax=Herbidospora sp. NBRC 101105 TaxID=3032195 RepID=UPI0024A29696|nr:hypothetical protein [Herbidospora sp. NBRC 101105]GLX99434.1 hypothetical protein Hesp01_73840 [Herbidospora sp. NBRC 101105]
MTQNVIDLIMADHRDVGMLFERLKTQPENRPALVAEPAKAAPSERGEVRHGIEEHHEAEELPATLMAADPDTGDFTTVLSGSRRR